MITEELVEWQIKDDQTGLVLPWWTHPFLDIIKTCDFSDKTWLEFGSGKGTAWLRSKCKWVDSIEASEDWAHYVREDCFKKSLNNGVVYSKLLADGVQETKQQYFDLIPNEKKYDIISVDGIWRYECLQWALDHFKGRGGMLIADNFDQDFVWISPSSIELMEPYFEYENVFYQPGHINHEGKPWNTRYWNIPA